MKLKRIATQLVAVGLLSHLESAIAAIVPMQVDAGSTGKAISPMIYGVNFGATSHFSPAGNPRAGLFRAGGDRWSTYNWVNNASNGAIWWSYRNDGYLSTSSQPGEAVTNRATQVFSNPSGKLLITVPMLGRVAADKLGDDITRRTQN